MAIEVEESDRVPGFMVIVAKEYTTRPYNNTLRGIFMTSLERREGRYQRRKAKREEKHRARVEKYDDFERVSSISALIKANWDSRKGVMWKASVARYNSHFIRNAVNSHNLLISGKDTRQDFYSFSVVERGKKRDVHSLHYAERVIRRSACINSLVPLLSSNLIYDNGASLQGKGVSFSIGRCETHLHDYYREYGNEGYILVIDFRHFFDNIRHEPLKATIARQVYDTRLYSLATGFVDSNGADMGLYIGPEDSQILAIAFPNSIDHLIKDQWGIKYYARYMDDSYIIMRDKTELQRVQSMLYEEYAKLGIVVNTRKTQIVKLSRGFTYLKTQFFLTDTGKVIEKPCHDNIVRQRRKLKAFRRFVMEGKMTIQQVNNAYMSWRGYILVKDAYRTVSNMDKLYKELFGISVK